MGNNRQPGSLSIDRAPSVVDGTSALAASPVPSLLEQTLEESLYHEYEHTTVLCRKAELTLDAVFTLLLSSAQYIAPTDQTNPVTDGMTVNVNIVMFGVVFSRTNPIRVAIKAPAHAVVNTTQPGHLLHPGSVTRTVLEQGADIVIYTKGIGTGLAQGSLNYVFFSPLLDYLRSRGRISRGHTPSGLANNAAAALVWGTVDQGLKQRLQREIHPAGGVGR